MIFLHSFTYQYHDECARSDPTDDAGDSQSLFSERRPATASEKTDFSVVQTVAARVFMHEEADRQHALQERTFEMKLEENKQLHNYY